MFTYPKVKMYCDSNVYIDSSFCLFKQKKVIKITITIFCVLKLYNFKMKTDDIVIKKSKTDLCVPISHPKESESGSVDHNYFLNGSIFLYLN